MVRMYVSEITGIVNFEFSILCLISGANNHNPYYKNNFSPEKVTSQTACNQAANA